MGKPKNASLGAPYKPPPLPRPAGMARWSMGPDGKPRIALGLTPSQWVVVIGLIAGGGTAYSELATESYVTSRVDGLGSKLEAMVTQQARTAQDVAAVSAKVDIMVRLETAHQAREERRRLAESYAEEVRLAKRRRMPEPAPPKPDGPAAEAARKLKVDPDDPLQGVPMPDD